MKKKRKSSTCSIRPPCLARISDVKCDVRGEIWIEKSGRLYMNTKRATLLDLIDEFGSLVAAARSMKLGYNTAWLWVMAMNRLSPIPLVKMGCGGANGGYSMLTEEGRRVVANFKQLNGSLENTMNQLASDGPHGQPHPYVRILSRNMEVADNALIKTASSY